MAREFAKAFYRSPAWLRCRKSYISYRQGIDGGMCEACGDSPGYIVHHKVYLTPDNINDPDVTLAFRNLEYVCLDCHNDVHNGSAVKLPKYIFTADGDVIPPP